MSTSSKYLGARRKLREKRKCTGLYSESSIDTADNEDELPREISEGVTIEEPDTFEDATSPPEITLSIPPTIIPIPINKDKKNLDPKSPTPSPPASLKSVLKNGNSKISSPDTGPLPDQNLNKSLRGSNSPQPSATSNTMFETTIAQPQKDDEGAQKTVEEANTKTLIASSRHQFRYPRSQTIPLLIRNFASRQIFQPTGNTINSNTNNTDISDDEALSRDSNEYLSMRDADSHNYRLKTPSVGKVGSGDVTPTYVDIIEKLTKSLEDEKEANAFLNQELLTCERRIKNLENELELLKMENERNKQTS